MCPTDNGLGELWLGMIATYGHRWISAYGQLPHEKGEDGKRVITKAGAIWQRGLFGIDDAMVRRGFEECIQRPDEWPPSLPAFRRMAMGIPSLAQVKADLRNAAMAQDRAPFTRLVWSYVDSYALARATSVQAHRLLQEAFENAVDWVMRGNPLPEPSKSLAPPPPDPRTPAKPETVAACTDEINRRLGLGPYAEQEQETAALPEPEAEATAP